jgi:divalent metal cation (Fe/Co/Zn/Cd) transporter
MQYRSGERTLRTAVILSSPGPLVLGICLIVGRSSTQLADFIRRSAELLAIIVSWIVFRLVHNAEQPDAARRKHLESIANTSVGAAMCLSGGALVLVALFSSNTEKGNVVPGLIIAVLGVITNAWFWLRYRQLDRTKPDAILAVQSRLYRAKTLVDLCVASALLVVALAPGSPGAWYVDLVGSLVVSVYLLINGVTTIRTKALKISRSSPS